MVQPNSTTLWGVGGQLSNDFVTLRPALEAGIALIGGALQQWTEGREGLPDQFRRESLAAIDPHTCSSPVGQHVTQAFQLSVKKIHPRK